MLYRICAAFSLLSAQSSTVHLPSTIRTNIGEFCVSTRLILIALFRCRGYGYITYDNSTSANDAVASMNLFDLGGQYLRVSKAITPPSAQVQKQILHFFSLRSYIFQVFTLPTESYNLPTASAMAAAAITAKICAMESTSFAVSQTSMLPIGSSSPGQSGGLS